MYLKTLRIRGFKSFPHAVELRFHEGIAVIVGPNGSGKSNIADALQWAMAVQSPSQLRAPNGQDVMFSGSDGRPPAGVCEVELVLDNECGTLPLEFGEVSVMRRLYRDAEGEYFVNRSRVRRLDVLELLADTGLGREMHSVIGQGRVEEVLVSKPHERRRFVEEAAGLGKFQRRRARAESKLDRVAAELERARDLEREVRARLRPLALQATAAERAARLASEIAVGRVALLGSELVGERRRASGLDEQLAVARATRSKVEARLAELAGQRGQAESELAGLAAAQERAAHAYYAFETARERVADHASRVAQGASRVARARERRMAVHARLWDDAARFAEQARTARDAAEQAAGEAAALAPVDDDRLRGATVAAEAALAAALDARRALAEAQGRASTVRREAEQLRARGQAGGDRAAQLEAAAETAAAQLEQAGADCVSLEEDSDARERERLACVQTETAATADEQAAAAAGREARAAADELEHTRDLVSTRLAALNRALERGEGLSPAAQALQAAGATLVAAGVDAEPGYERAVAAALGWRAGAVVAHRLEDAVGLLRSAEGELAVVLADAGAVQTGLPPVPGARPLAEVASVSDPAVARLIEGVWLVTDLSQVTSGVAVTAAGEGIDVDRGELWRAADAGEAAWMAARAERDRVAGELPEIEAQLERARSVAAAAAERQQQAQAAAERARAALAGARAAATRAIDAARQASARRDGLADELARLDAARDLAARDREADTARLTELESLAEASAGEEAERRTAATAADEHHGRLEMERRELADAAATVAARRAGLDERRQRHGEEADRLTAAAAQATADGERAQAACAAADPVLELADRLRVELARASAAAELLRTPARADVASVERRAGELSAQLQACAEAEAAEQAEARAADLAATEVEVGRARSAERISDLERRRAEIAAQHQVEVEDPEAPLPPDEAAGLAARLERLERRRESLGAVNPLAAEEYEAERGRAGELEAQIDDLERSLRERRSLIRDLTDTIDRRFAETFQEVADHFDETVRTLFPGGSGRLRLTEAAAAVEAGGDSDEEELPEQPREAAAEPGIELEVRPAGKRIESLSLLSGGEKSLTAIAFLFALMLTKPSPFYVLDEVEAALDDSNIERFLSLLRAYQSRAQFIVITHQRRTMEVADVLYGVSMAGDGESKVLSRRMPAESDLHHALDSA
ncbi:MAG: chromosome segregation protein SMC [Gaiellales bacterium]